MHYAGDFSRATMKLDGNNLIEFSAAVFESVLSQMALSGTSSYIDVNRSKFALKLNYAVRKQEYTHE